jgi:D-3-phosphoglycerate dehydrogenase / 2-oxoglutarate reductase
MTLSYIFLSFVQERYYTAFIKKIFSGGVTMELATVKPIFCVANRLSMPALQFLEQQGRVDIMYEASPMDLLEAIPCYDALLIRSATKVNSDLIQAGSRGRLKVIGTATAGVDHIDLKAAQEQSVMVVNSTWGNSLANAEFIIGMMIALSRNFLNYDRSMRRGEWNQELGIGAELGGKIFGTVGFGRIGSLAAEKARLLGMRVMAFDPFQPIDAFTARGVERVELPELLRSADFLSLSLPHYSNTIHLIGAQELQLLKPTCFLIQSSRGGIIDESALIEVLKKKQIAGASIDVFANEPAPRKEFLELDNTILTPHIGCSSQESRVRSGLRVAEDVLRVLRGEKPLYEVKPIEDPRDFHRLLG